ncbi:MAG: hypothetical protein R3C56_12810 [Pirellulaceae bacterium]
MKIAGTAPCAVAQRDKFKFASSSGDAEYVCCSIEVTVWRRPRPENGSDSIDRLMGDLLMERPLEVDKIFRALVKLQGSDLHESRPTADRACWRCLKPLNRPPIDNEMVVHWFPCSMLATERFSEKMEVPTLPM